MKTKIYKFRIKNYLNIEEFELDLSPGMQGFVGENDQGKTNIITAIQDFLTGENDVRKIMRGKEKAELELSEYIDDKLEAKVTRVFVPGKSSQFKGKGLKGSSPKSYITELFAAEAINPLYLISNDIVKYLKKHLPVKALEEDIKILNDYDVKFNLNENAFGECDRMIEYFQDVRERTYGVMRHKREVVAELVQNLPAMPETTVKSRDNLEKEADKVKADIALIDEHNKFRLSFQKRVDDLTKDISAHSEAIDHEKESLYNNQTRENQLKDQRRIAVDLVNKKYDELDFIVEKEIASSQGIIDEMKKEIIIKKEQREKDLKQKEEYNSKDKSHLEIELQGLRNEYSENERAKEIQKQHDQVGIKKGELLDVEEKYEQEDEIYKHFAYALPKILISRANLPVDGVEFKDDELYVNNEHIDRLASSNRHKVAAQLAAGLARAKGHIALCLDGIEILDDKNRRAFMLEMKEHCKDLRFIYTRHGKPEYDFETKVVDGKLVD